MMAKKSSNDNGFLFVIAVVMSAVMSAYEWVINNKGVFL